jgi:hypothetical protein
MPGDAAVETKKSLANTLAVGMNDPKPDIVAEGTHVGHMVVEAFKLEQDRPQ